MKNRRQKKRSNIKSKQGCPRLSVFRSSRYIFAQIIDDEKGQTLVSASSLKLKNGQNVEAAKTVGKVLAEAAKKEKIKRVVFDRGRRIYHGRVSALAQSARENGLIF